jgi:hypothetical protein
MLHRCIDVDNHSSYYLGDTMIKKGMQDYSNVLLHAKNMIRAINVVFPDTDFEMAAHLPSEIELIVRDGHATAMMYVPEDVDTANYAYVENVYGTVFDADTRILSLPFEV